MTKTVTRDELQALIAGGEAPILIEALPEKYFEQGHLPGARHLPHDAVKERAGEVAPDKAAPIVVYCASATCRNSHQAAAALTQLGYTDVAVYPGGKQDWEQAGLPFETD
jgi:rhodanese-related sulfurtransferase